MSKISHDSETPAHGQQVITVCAFIHHTFDGVTKVFLPKRAATKKFLPNVYNVPGGHVDYGEDLVTALKREIQEEFGKKVTVGDPFATFDYMNEIKGTHSVEIIYFAQFEDGNESIELVPEDHSSYAWIAENELESMFTAGREANDPELTVMKKGFALLSGESPQF
ncbi:MAG TPA: NUDIX hydrolase [Verrucomicrobiae bacterium]|nr:NUDIX hydrolase [Verrucomicrobiae bacterium]